MMNRTFVKAGNLVLAALLAAVFTGCAGYQLGSMLPDDIRTVYVPTFKNRTTEPLIEIETTQAAIEQIQLDGSLLVVDEQDADAILEVDLLAYDLEALSFERTDRRQANEYRATITASIVLKRRATDEVILEEPLVRGDTTFPFTADLSSTKRRALPDAAEDLGHDIVERIVEFW
jgi:hypothetical protein